MSTESTTKPTGPLRCTCGNTAGPFDPKIGRCEDCTDNDTSKDSE
ncbi:hypothetical protein ABZ341_18020 [Streptomyces sp. NPDC006173]